MTSTFGETVSPVAAIQAILHDYPFSASILRELLQNSDDASATRQIFVLDKGDDPALIAYNNSEFLEADWQSIQSIHQSSKKADTSKIGKYGVGFRACYHITDQPQILSGSFFAVLDPLHSNSMKIEHDKFKDTEYRKHFDFFSSMFETGSFTGTAIRLPLRSSSSELSQRVVLADELHKMIEAFVSEELDVSLLFLDQLRTIEIWESSNGAKTRLAMWTKSGTTASRQDPSVSLVAYNTVLSDGNTEYLWQIVQTQSSDEEAISRLSQAVGIDSVNALVQKHKLRPDVRIAYRMRSNEQVSGRLFTFLPLPSMTGFPIHIHALFALISSRQSLRNPNETGIVQGSDNDVLVKWNHLLFNHYIPQCWGYLLKTLAEEATTSNIFSAWPPYHFSITSGDGIYWQSILSQTFKIVVESELKVWPQVSAGDSTTYVELKSSLIVAQGQVDEDILTVLASLGLTLVQLPQYLLTLVDESMITLSPTIAHGKLQGKLDRFDQLSGDQRGLVCKYLLSDRDISNIFGLPLIPILNGSFVALDHRNQSLRRFIALTKDEATIFRASACEAIPLDDLSPNLARLLREQGINRANVDLLVPRHVIDYLSNEAQTPGDERLVEFWRWVCDWHLKDELISLLKDNSRLPLIPTTKGPRPVPSPVFNLIPNNDVQLFGKLGLAFITSVLPATVVTLLLNHNILKNANELNHFVAAVNLDSMPSLTDDEAKAIFIHVMAYYGPVNANALTKLRTLPIFPVLVPIEDLRRRLSANSSVTWRSIHELTIKGISPLKLIPVSDNVHFLSESNIRDATSSVLKKLHIPVLKDEDILSHALDLFTSQPKPLQAAFVSYIKHNQYRLPVVRQMLQKTPFLHTSDGSLQSPENVIDPTSPLIDLFPQGCKNSRIPVNEDEYDRQLFDDLRVLGLTKTKLEVDLVQERISYISSNYTSQEVVTVTRSLLALMNKPTFSCHGLLIDPNMSWLPTANGLTTSKKCINHGRHDTDLFDEVLVTLDESISISTSFKEHLDWDKPIPLEILAEQLRRVLDSPFSDVQIRKIRNIIKELSNQRLRNLSDADVEVIRTAINGRAWIPTKFGQLAQPSRVVFVNVEDSSGFHEAAFLKSDNEVYQFLCRMGCLERPTAAAIIEELKALQEKSKEDGTVAQRAIVLLEMLPGFMTEEESASLLVPDELGYLVPPSSGISYYSGSGEVDPGSGTVLAHHLVTERLAEKLRMNRLGIEAEDDIDLGGKPITTIRNALKQYEPQQFFTEFVANASDAKAKKFSLLVDDHEGPVDPKKLFSVGMAAFQSTSLVVYNDGVFDKNDFKGIRDTGIGGKREKSDVIGYFGLGALSMFHFTELAMIVSGGHVLFLNPAKHSLGFRDRNSVLLPLHHVKRLYHDHLEPLDGLFGFDLNSTEFYKGTMFRLPLRNQSHLTNEASAVSLDTWSIKTVEDMLLEQFDNLAYKSLLFTGLARIDLLARRGSQLETLRLVEVTRVPDNSITEIPFESEIMTFQMTNSQKKWLVLSKPVKIPEEFAKALQGRRNILPVKIAAALGDNGATSADRNLFCALPLPVTTSLPVHISAPFILEQERRNIRLDNLGMGSKYNHWLLTSEIPSLYLYLLETLLSTQGTNESLWPPMNQERNGGNSMASQIFVDAFWTREILATSPRRIFASRTSPSTYLAPKDVVLLVETHSYFNTLSKIVDISKPANVVDLSTTLYDAASHAGLHFIDAPFVKNLLQDPQVCQELNEDEKQMALSFLCFSGVPLHGLQLLPLEDGSYRTISLKADSDRTYYVVEQASGASYPPFNKDRLIHQSFKTCFLDNGYTAAWKHLLSDHNVSILSDEGIVELTNEYIKPADEFVGDHPEEAWIDKFWRAKLTKPQAVSQFPLVSTYKPLHYISLRKVDDSSVIVLEDHPSEQQSLYSVLQALGLTIVVRQTLPSHLREAVQIKKLDVYTSFLNFLKEYPDKLKIIRQLAADDQMVLGSWIQSQFSRTPKEFADIACQIPAWPVQQGANNTRLASLNDDDVTILPSGMPVTILCPFTNHAIMDWKECMKDVKKGPCITQRIVELLRVSNGTVLRLAERDKYKEFIKKFVKMDKVANHPLLVPNSDFRLRPASDLFENAELFIATFKSDSPHLLSQSFQDLVLDLEKYGLKRQRRLDFSMFIECAAAFDSDRDRDRNKRPRGEVLYGYFNSLRLSPDDARRCRELDNFKFIPRIDIQRPGYGDINTIEYMPDSLPRVLLAPTQITIPGFEAICWSQKGKTNPSPNLTLCGTYQSLGKPNESDVLGHLLVLAEIAQDHGRHTGLLSDLKATYRWLNDHAGDVARSMAQRRNDNIFLNVDDPESDKWTWHSASKLVIGIEDLKEIREVKGFLRNYSELLNVAGVRRVQKGPVKTVPATENTSLDLREHFNTMRQAAIGTDTIFATQDIINQILPVHKVWLIANNTHFRTVFVGSGMRESQMVPGHHTITVVRSSMCAKGVVDWFYISKLPDFLTNSSSGNDEETKQRLDLALEMLSLSDEWEVTDLHGRLQMFIMEDPHFVNPYWVGAIREHAEASGAKQLLEYCRKYEETNQTIIDDFTGCDSNVVDDNDY